MAFSSWDTPIFLKNIQISTSKALDYDWVAELGPQNSWIEEYIPSYIVCFEEEREKKLARAGRFDIEFKPSSLLEDMAKLPPLEMEKLRLSQIGRASESFITGFDPKSPEEIEKRKTRAARFGLSKKLEQEEKEELEAKKQRASRFGVPLTEQEAIFLLIQRTPVKRRIVSDDEVIRAEKLHLYGNFSGMNTRDVLQNFQPYGPSHMEWINDQSCNIVFADFHTCERCQTGLCKDIPPPIEVDEESCLAKEEKVQLDKEMSALILENWKYTTLHDGEGKPRIYLVRIAYSGDIKAVPKAKVELKTKKFQDRVIKKRSYNQSTNVTNKLSTRSYDRTDLPKIAQKTTTDQSENVMETGEEEASFGAKKFRQTSDEYE